MPKLIDLSKLTPQELQDHHTQLVEELARRHVDSADRPLTMTDMELAVERMASGGKPPAIAAMLNRMRPEKRTAKACPRCAKRTPVKARDRQRTVESMAGSVTYRRNYHYCADCKHGFYPADRLLGVPEEGALTEELEKRVLDFAVNDVFGEGAARWKMHYPFSISDNLLRRVADRVGRAAEEADQAELQQKLLAREQRAPVLVVENDGGHLPMRGAEPWKEAKVGVIRTATVHPETNVVTVDKESPRYVAVLGNQDEFAAAMQSALQAEGGIANRFIAWLGDGAPGNWTLAQSLCLGCSRIVQILDWHHAVEHGMTLGRALLGEDESVLGLWKARLETLLFVGNNDLLVSELMACLDESTPSPAIEVLDDLVRYYRANCNRMDYAKYRSVGLPIGSGTVESAHRHVLQVRMKRAGQHWSQTRARRMVRLRAAYRTAGAAKFHRAIRSSPVQRQRNPAKAKPARKRYASNR
jgi:hypothetical protein